MDITGTVLLRKDEIIDISKLQTILTIDNPAHQQFFRFKNPRYVKESEIPPETLSFLVQEGKCFRVPRNIPDDLIDTDEINDLRLPGRKIHSDFWFKGDLRDYQKDYISGIPIMDSTDFVMEVPCGHGKTIMGIYLSSIYKLKTIVLVPTLYLAKQWLNECKTFMPEADASIYEIGDDYRKTDILIINLDRVNAANFGSEFYNEFGLLLSDEAHRDGAETYFPIVNKLNTRRRIALTATFRRSDGMHNILKYVFGRVYTMKSQFTPAQVIPFLTGLSYDLEDYCSRSNFKRIDKLTDLPTKADVLVKFPGERDLVPAKTINRWKYFIQFKDEEAIELNLDDYDSVTKYTPKVNFSKLDNLIAANSFRNKILLSLIKKLVKQGRTILFLSKRRAFLETFSQGLSNVGYKTELVVGKGGKKKDHVDLKHSDAQIIFGIDRLAKEGLDAPKVDTLILHHPLKDIEQAKGRIERFLPGKKDPLLFYVLDANDICWNIFKASHKYLKGSKVVKSILWSDYFKTLK